MMDEMSPEERLEVAYETWLVDEGLEPQSDEPVAPAVMRKAFLAGVCHGLGEAERRSRHDVARIL